MSVPGTEAIPLTLRNYDSLRDNIFTAILEGQQVYSPLPITSCYELAQQSITRFVSSTAVAEIRKLFVEAGFAAQIGYNQGSDLLSVYFPLPSLKEQRERQLTTKESIIWTMLGLLHEQSQLEDDFTILCRMLAEQNTTSPTPIKYDKETFDKYAHSSKASVDSKDAQMTNMTPQQTNHSAIELHADKNNINQSYILHRRTRTLNRLLSSARTTHDPLLINRCIRLFTEQTKTAITGRKCDLKLGTMTLVLRPARRGVTAIDHPKSGPAPQLSILLTEDERTELQLDKQPQHQHQHQLQQGKQSWRHLIATPRQLSDDSTPVLSYHAAYTIVSGADDLALVQLSTSLKVQSGDDQTTLKDGEEGHLSQSETKTLSSSSLTQSSKTTYWSDDVLLEQRNWLTIALVDAIWSYATTTMRYYPDANLKSQVSSVLTEFIYHATQTCRAEFTPGKPLTIFLNGPPGTGKSRFVKVFSEALLLVVSKVFEPRKRVEIVRIPFNQTSPAALSTTLMVRGISDWSIERIVEQTICRGGLCFLHLEEQPPEPQLQNELFALTSSMARTLCNRYPEYRNNVINILTSNYSPSPEIAAKSKCVDISPPSQSIQQEWCSRTLEDAIAGTILLLPRSNLSSKSSSSSSSCESPSTPPPLPLYAPHPSPPPYFNPYGYTPRHRIVTANQLEFSSLLSAYPSAFTPHQTQDPSSTSSSTPSPSTSSAPASSSSPSPSPSLPIFIQFLTKVILNVSTPQTEDMRRLGTWKLSLSFAILQSLSHHIPSYITKILQTSSPSTMTDTLHSTSFIQIACTATINPDSDTLSSSSLSSSSSTQSSSSSFPRITIAVSYDTFPLNLSSSTSPSPIHLPLIHLHSTDGFFYMPTQPSPTSQVPSPLPPPSSLPPALESCLPLGSTSRLLNLINMWLTSYLKPTVLVLHGSPASTHRAALAIRYMIHQCTQPYGATSSSSAPINTATIPTEDPIPTSNILLADVSKDIDPTDPRPVPPSDALRLLLNSAADIVNDTDLHNQQSTTSSSSSSSSSSISPSPSSQSFPGLLEFFARCRSDRDRRQLLGDPDPQTGLLMRFIHATNSETRRPSLSGTPSVGFIMCIANEFGQFTLRELMDSGHSSTHTTNLRKDGLFFLVVVDHDSKIQPQLVSRAHDIITLPG